MASAKHRTREFRLARVKLTPVVESGRGWCVQPECVMPSRYIVPGSPWDVAHDDAGRILGPAHRKCNRRDGWFKGKGRYMRRPPAPAPRRWQL